MGNNGSRSDTIDTDQESPKSGVATMAENDQAMTPDGKPGTASEDPSKQDDGGAGTQAGDATTSDARTTPRSEAEQETHRDEEE